MFLVAKGICICIYGSSENHLAKGEKISCKDFHVKESQSEATNLNQQVLTGQNFIKMIVDVHKWSKLLITGPF